MAGCLSEHFTIPNIVFVVYRKVLSLIKKKKSALLVRCRYSVLLVTSLDDSLSHSLSLLNTTSGAFVIVCAMSLLFIQGDLNHPRDSLDNEESLSLCHSVKALAVCNRWRKKKPYWSLWDA